MLKRKEKKYKECSPDYILIGIVFLILIFGLVSLSTSSIVVAYQKFGDPYHYVKRQMIGIVLGLVAFWVLSKTDYHKLKKHDFKFLIFSFILLTLVFIPGLSASYGKARSWINVFGFSVQPSEFVKLSFLLFLSSWLERTKNSLHDIFKGIGPFIIILALISLLMILQPDIGTLSILGITSLLVYFVGGGKIKHISVIILVGIVVIFSMIMYKPYIKNRFACMVDPTFSSNDICYQTNQSLIAVGSGGIFGRGIGQSRQKFMYLPEVSGDSIFAIIAEEMGFLVSALFIFLYFSLFFRGILIAKKAPDDFGRILATGIVIWLTVQTAVNIGGIVNLIPMTGVPLPLVSSGGSAIAAALAALGVLVNISKYSK